MFKKGGYDKRVKILGPGKGTARYVNHVEETVAKAETANVFEYQYEERDGAGETKTVKFQWLTDIELTTENLEVMIEAARGRWKIENKGFNNQKKWYI